MFLCKQFARDVRLRMNKRNTFVNAVIDTVAEYNSFIIFSQYDYDGEGNDKYVFTDASEVIINDSTKSITQTHA